MNKFTTLAIETTNKVDTYSKYIEELLPKTGTFSGNLTILKFRIH